MNQNLLDTHTLIWFLNGSEDISKNAINAITADGAVNFVSIASLWEIAIKISINKLEINFPLNQIDSKLVENNFEVLPITVENTLTVCTLPFNHRDPFDRIIIAQAKDNQLTIITKDKTYIDYDVEIIW